MSEISDQAAAAMEAALASDTPVTTPAGFVFNAQEAANFDFVILCDQSGSMAAKSTRFPGKNRWEEMQELAFGLAAAVEKFDSDGLDLVFFGGQVTAVEGVTADTLLDEFSKRSPMGTTPLDEALAWAVQKQKSSGKNTVGIVFTDGAPDDRAAAAKVIVDAANALTKDEALTFLFIQIGGDASATAYLKALDDDLDAAKFDIVDAMTGADAEKMLPIDLIAKAIAD